MSRGLGALQREILAALPASKPPHASYRGGGADARGVFARAYALFLYLPADVYDLRAVSFALSRPDGAGGREGRRQGAGAGYPGRQDNAYSAAFSRAVRGLVARGVLAPLTRVPCAALFYDLADAYGRRCREPGPKHPAWWRIGWDGEIPVVEVGARPVRFIRLAPAIPRESSPAPDPPPDAP